MEERCHFYSTYDMSIPFSLKRADGIINSYKKGWRPESVDDVIELYNIWLFVENDIYSKDWDGETLQLIRKDFKVDVVRYFSDLKKETWVSVFKQIEYGSHHCFWEIIDRFSVDGLLDIETLREAFKDNPYELHDVLCQERLVSKHQQIITALLKENPHAAEWLLQEFVEEENLSNRSKLFFPKSLTLQDRDEIISHYLDNEKANLNYVRLVVQAKKDANLKLSDPVRLKAIRLEEKLNAEVLETGSVIHCGYGVIIDDNADKPIRWIERDDNNNLIHGYSRQIVEQCPEIELPHYIRSVYEFLTPIGLIPFVFKISESEVMERLVGLQGKYSYQTNIVFRYHEAISFMQIEALQKVLSDNGKSIEGSLKLFYEQYLKNRYGYPSGTLTLADTSADLITKCRAIAPEIDVIAQRYDLYARTGSVDEDLLHISSENVRITSARSAIPVRYYAIKGQPKELYRLFHYFFSDQCMLNYVEPFKGDKYRSFYQLLMVQDGNICYANYHDYQRNDIDYLVEEGFLSKDENGMLHVEKAVEIWLLKLLYDYHSCPARVLGSQTQKALDEMIQKGWLEPDEHLLSEEERNYFDYYLYNSKYTNNPALRNRYVHGKHVDAEKENVHRIAYNRLLILLILELLKIEEDLIVRQGEINVNNH